jgi:hypothetical protein
LLTRNGEQKVNHSSNSELRRRYDVAIIMDKSATGFLPISERVMMFNIACNKETINLIQVYTSTTDNYYADTRKNKVSIIRENYDSITDTKIKIRRLMEYVQELYLSK